MGKRLYILYDSRAVFDPDDATVYCTASSLKEAKKDRREMFPDAVCYSYDSSEKTLKDRRYEFGPELDTPDYS